jgi:ABC-2 type transport system permease protein
MTRVAAGTTARRRRAAGDVLTGTLILLRFMLRRDRISIAAWIVVLAGFTAIVAVSFPELYPTPEQRQGIALAMSSPAAIAMIGVNHGAGDYHVGAMMAHQMLWFSTLLAGLMSILMMVRHTRQEEATGRAELVRSTVVGRHATTAAALLAVAVANVGLGVAMAVSLGASGVEGVTWGGSWLYGAAHVAVGLTFAGVAAVTAQMSEHARGATGMALAVLGLAYVVRALGDMAGNASSWLSPIGWAQATQVYVSDLWWPLLAAVGATALLVAAALALSTRRDVGAGLRAPTPGAAHASSLLTTPIGFALRLQRAGFSGWAAAIFVLGVMYGSILGDAEQMLADVDVMTAMLAGMPGAGVVETFGAMIASVTAILAAAYAVLATLRLRTEELAGRAESVLATALSRTRWVMSHVVVAAVGSLFVLVGGGLGLGLAGGASTGDWSLLPAFVAAMAAYAPAVWIVIGLAVALFGLAPLAIGATWLLVAYAFVVIYLGGLLQFPAWMEDLSPFGHVPRMPAEDFALAPLLVLTAVAALLVVVGLVGFRRRDVPLI